MHWPQYQTSKVGWNHIHLFRSWVGRIPSPFAVVASLVPGMQLRKLVSMIDMRVVLAS
jgi:hypothetical protein